MSMKKCTPLNLISSIYDAQEKPEDRPLNCFGVYRILKSVFPDAEPFYDGSHVYTKINGVYYDIDGIQRPNISEIYPMLNEITIMKKVHRWKK